jgi:hypothetical protein
MVNFDGRNIRQSLPLLDQKTFIFISEHLGGS